MEPVAPPPPPPLLLLTVVLSCCCGCLLHAAGDGSAVTPPPPSRPCTDSRPPVVLAEALTFCGNTGISCCDATDDAALREAFLAMNNVSDSDPASVAKDRLCARCRPDERFATPAGSMSGAAPCVERIDEGSYLGVAAHPDGSARVFLSTRDGKILLTTVPPRGSGRALRVDGGGGAGPFLDLAGRLRHDAAKGLGLMGVAFHPGFATNGRFFVSYTCDGASSPSRTAAAPGGPSAYQLVVDEFSAKGSAADLSKADPSQVRRVFTMALPNTSVNQPGGQIRFQPAGGDGYLYLIAGHGGDGDLHGKIIRLDVDRSPPPLMHRPETLTGSLNDPRGCSFDSKWPSDLYCANINEQQYEQVYLISNKAGASPSLVVGHGRPANGGAPSIVGGLVYRGTANPSLRGRYLYMYGSAAWTAALEAPASSGRQPSAQLLPNITCSGSTPLPCRGGLVGGRVLALGEDNSKDALLLATDGVYRVVQPKLCGGAPPPPPRSKPWLGWLLSAGTCALALAFYQIYLTMFAGGSGGGQPATSCNGWFSCCASVMCCNNTVINNNGPDVTA